MWVEYYKQLNEKDNFKFFWTKLKLLYTSASLIIRDYNQFSNIINEQEKIFKKMRLIFQNF